MKADPMRMPPGLQAKGIGDIVVSNIDDVSEDIRENLRRFAQSDILKAKWNEVLKHVGSVRIPIVLIPQVISILSFGKVSIDLGSHDRIHDSGNGCQDDLVTIRLVERYASNLFSVREHRRHAFSNA